MRQDQAEHWGIVGGGMLGMTLALRLAQDGHRVTLLEAADTLGGLADAWQVGDVRWDRHYHVTLLSDAYMRALLAELGLEDAMHWRETKTGFFTDGRLYSMSNTWEFLKFPPLRLIDKLRLGGTIFYASKIRNWRRLERVLVADWLRRLSGKRTYDKIWQPLLRSKLGDNYRRTSAAFIWATIARMYAARRTGLKKEMFGYVPGGYARILERMQSHLENHAIDIQLRRAVREVTGDGRHGLQVQYAEGTSSQFDRVALTVPAPTIARMCPGLTAAEQTRLQNVAYQGIVCASVVLRRPLGPYYVTNITDDGVPFTGVIEMSALVDRELLGGHALVYLPRYLPSDDPALETSDDQLHEEFLTALERMYPDFRRDDVLAFRVSRVRHVCALPTLNYSQHVPAMDTSIPGLHVVTSAQIVNGTLNVNETVRLAEEAAIRLSAQRPSAEDGQLEHDEQKDHEEAYCQLVPGP